MALATSILSGDKGEWALTKRHRSEKEFGIQVCGSKPQQLVTAAEAIVQQCDSVDFVDVNLGCPIDLVFNKELEAPSLTPSVASLQLELSTGTEREASFPFSPSVAWKTRQDPGGHVTVARRDPVDRQIRERDSTSAF